MANTFRKYQYYLSSIPRLLTGFVEWPKILGVFLRLYRTTPFEVQLRHSGVRFSARSPMDLWSIKEAFIDRFYERYGFPIEKRWTVVDIGAGIGEYTLLAAITDTSNRVIAFEPFAESYKLLRQNLRLNGAINVSAVPIAISSRTGQLSLDLSAGEPLKIESHLAEIESATGAAGLVECLSLADAFERYEIEHCDLLKLDCEGAEYDILFYASAETLSRVKRIVMEYHDGKTAYSHKDMEHHLRDHGYRVESVVNVVHGDIGYLSAIRP